MDDLHLVENRIATEIVDAAFWIHKALGPGLLESVYERVLEYELRRRAFRVERQLPIQVKYKSLTFDEGFRADLVINKRVMIELKSVEQLNPVHKKQLLTYLKLTDIRLGLLINFGAPLIKQGIVRLVNGLQ